MKNIHITAVVKIREKVLELKNIHTKINNDNKIKEKIKLIIDSYLSFREL